MAQREDIKQLLGQVWHGRYEILEFIGRGGMGAVFKARQLKMDREVALKVIHRELSEDPRSVQRFEGEAKVTSRLDHPNSIRVYDFGKSSDGHLFIAMEYLRGETLARLLSDAGPLAPERVVRIARQILKSLGEAHEKGLVHRDLKPENIFMCEIYGERDYVKVLDFGIAKAVGANAEQANLTQTGFICGTPRYLSPEQALGQPVDGRSDLYSVAVLMYEMLTGRPPFVGDNPISIVMKHVHDDPPPIVGAVNLGKEGQRLAWVIMRLLEKAPSRRPALAAEVVAFLDGDDGAFSIGRPPAWSQSATPMVSLPPLPGASAQAGTHGAATQMLVAGGTSDPDQATLLFDGSGVVGGSPPGGPASDRDATILLATVGASDNATRMMPQVVLPQAAAPLGLHRGGAQQTAVFAQPSTGPDASKASVTSSDLARVQKEPVWAWILSGAAVAAIVLISAVWWLGHDDEGPALMTPSAIPVVANDGPASDTHSVAALVAPAVPVKDGKKQGSADLDKRGKTAATLAVGSDADGAATPDAGTAGGEVAGTAGGEVAGTAGGEVAGAALEVAAAITATAGARAGTLIAEMAGHVGEEVTAAESVRAEAEAEAAAAKARARVKRLRSPTGGAKAKAKSKPKAPALLPKARKGSGDDFEIF